MLDIRTYQHELKIPAIILLLNPKFFQNISLALFGRENINYLFHFCELDRQKTVLFPT